MFAVKQIFVIVLFLCVTYSLYQPSLWKEFDRIDATHTLSNAKGDCHHKRIRVRDWSWNHCARVDREAVSDLLKSRSDGLPDCLFLLPLMDASDPGSIAIDVGANIGGCAMLLASAGYKVMAFEPVLANAWHMWASADRVDLKISTHALGREKGTRRMVSQEGNMGNSQVLTERVVKDTEDAVMNEAVVMHMARLDDVLQLARAGEVAIMKMDVQGYETNVLQGGRRSLGRGVVRAILFECEDVRLFAQQSSPEELYRTLSDLGFVIVSVQGKRVRRHEMAHLCGPKVRDLFGSMNMYALHRTSSPERTMRHIRRHH